MARHGRSFPIRGITIRHNPVKPGITVAPAPATLHFVASATISLLQHNSVFAGQSGGSVAFTLNTSPGTLLVLHIGAEYNGAYAGVGVTDSLGNTWVEVVVGGATDALWYAKNPAGGANTVTVTGTIAYSYAARPALQVTEWAGVDAASPLDQSAAGASTSTGPVTTTVASELIVSGFSTYAGSVTPDSGYTLIDAAGWFGSGNDLADAFQIAGAPGPYSASWSPAGGNPCVSMAAFKPASIGVIAPTFRATLHPAPASLAITAATPLVPTAQALHPAAAALHITGATPTINAGSPAVVVFDAAASAPMATGSGLSSISWSHTTGAGSNAMFVVVQGLTGAGAGGSYGVPTYGAQTFGATPLLSVGPANWQIQVWMLPNPTPGTNTVTVTFLTTNQYYFGVIAGSISAFNADLSNPVNASASATALSQTITTTRNGCMTIGSVNNWNSTVALSTSQTVLFSNIDGGTFNDIAAYQFGLPIGGTTITFSSGGGTVEASMFLAIQPALSTGSTTISPPSRSLTITAATPVIRTTQAIHPAAASLALSPLASTLRATTRPTLKALAITGVTPTTRTTLHPAAASLAITGVIPATRATLRPAVASLALSPASPALCTTLRPASVALAITGIIPTFRATLHPAPRALVLSSFTSTLRLTTRPALDALVIAGRTSAVMLTGTMAVVPAHASLALTAATPVVRSTVTGVLHPAPASLAVAGTVSVLHATQRFQPVSVAMALTAASPQVAKGTIPAKATLTISAGSPSLRLRIAPAAAALLLAPASPSIRTTRHPASQALAIAPGAVVLRLSIHPAARALTLVPGAPTLRISARPIAQQIVTIA